MKSASIFLGLLLISSVAALFCPFKSIDGSVFFGACILGTDGDHLCYTTSGGTFRPLGYGYLSALSVGFSRICGLDAFGFASCASAFNRTMVAPTIPFSSISVGSTTACGIAVITRDVVCFVVDSTAGGFSRVVAGPFASVSTGIKYACGLRPDGTLVCWGDAASIARAPTSIKLAKLSLGHGYNCGIGLNGVTYCWDNAGLYTNVGGYNWTDISCSNDQPGCCGWTSARSSCWGSPIYPSDSVNSQLPTPKPTFKHLTLSNAFGCGLVSNSLSAQFFSGSIGGQSFNTNIKCSLIPFFNALPKESEANAESKILPGSVRHSSNAMTITLISVPIGIVIVLVATATIAFVVFRIRKNKIQTTEDEVVELSPISS